VSLWLVSTEMSRSRFLYRFGTAEFDEARFELRVGGLPVDVEHRALEVLACLLNHAGEVVTKDELLREVWAGRVTVDKVLTNAVAKLRRALGEANAEHVATQARLGYRLQGDVTRTAVGRQPSIALSLQPGQPVPGRAGFVLRQALGGAAPGSSEGMAEVWLAEHPKTHETRVYKFTTEGGRLRSLKREVTLLRVLQEGGADPSTFVELLDWNFETVPYFIECRYGGESLASWATRHLAPLDGPARVALFVQIAQAVATAHALGVLHKDLKPANVLVSGDAFAPHVRLTDFGSARLLDPDRLDELGITRMGMTVQDAAGADSTSGTPLYLAPELFEGQVPTVRSDVYALGQLLYQLLTGRLGQPMASGWEDDIADPLLREDLRLATAGDPQRRLGSAAELVQRLQQLEGRRQQQQQAQAERDAAQQARQALARAQARRPLLLALLAALALGVGVTAWLWRAAVDARDQLGHELARNQALTRFLNEDLIGRANLLVTAKGAETTLKEMLLSGRERVAARFDGQPAVAAALHGSLAASFAAVELLSEAEAEARRAIELLEQQALGLSANALQARAVLVRVLARRGQLPAAQQQLDELRRLASTPGAAPMRPQIDAASGVLHASRNEYAAAARDLRAAADALAGADLADAALRDAVRLDLIFALSLAGQDADARAEGARLIAEGERRPGDNALLIALARVSLARAQGEDHDAAQKLLLAAQPVIVARLGDNHSRHLRLLNELFAVAFRRADWPRALDHARQVHERVRAKYGDDNVTTHVTLLNWGRALSEAGQPSEALARLRPAHERLVAMLGAAAPQAQDAAFVLALALLNLDRTAAAQPLIDGLDAKVLEAGRATGTWAAGIDALRGMAAQQRGQTDLARRLLTQALQALQEEATLAQPARVYLSAQQALKNLP
jgi:DNA-binding winged helix-turn-helix (wHTH) protein